MDPTYFMIVGFSDGLKEVKKRSASSAEKVLNVIDASSARRSASEDGKRKTLKSVRWLQRQWRKPSGAPLGGGDATQPRELYLSCSSSQKVH